MARFRKRQNRKLVIMEINCAAGDPSRKAVAYSPEFLRSTCAPYNTRAYLGSETDGMLPDHAMQQEGHGAQCRT